VLRKNKKLKPFDIKGIDLHINNITNFLINNSEPKNSYGCKFSIQYCVAAMLKYGEMGVEQFASSIINDEEVRDMMKHITIIQDPEIEAVHARDSSKLASKVVFHCKDGRTLEMQVDYPKGDSPNPMTWEDSVEKFRHLTVPVYGEMKAEKLLNLIDNLEQFEDFSKAINKIVK
jgi:2-methylcitrate dehydratase PrpD